MIEILNKHYLQIVETSILEAMDVQRLKTTSFDEDSSIFSQDEFSENMSEATDQSRERLS